MTRAPALPNDPAALARTLLPVGLAIVAALVRETRPFVLVALVAGVTVGIRRDVRVRWAWAAPIPAVVALCWGLLPAPVASTAGLDCTNVTSPPAVWRAGEGILVIATVAVLGWALRAPAGELGLRWPKRSVVQLAAVAFVILGPLALILGATLAAPFFGSFTLDLGQPAAIVPALVFAVANGVGEEVAYRGALTAWTARTVGWMPAVVAQAIVFGAAHSGPDFVASPLPVMGAMAAGALIAGLITLRTRSLLLPIAAHVALDLPLYYYLACRTG